MITVVRDKFPGLAACFNDARALRELMPDAINLYVKEFGWCAHCEPSVRSIPIFLVGRGRDEFVAEFRDKALSGPQTGFPKGADGSTGDIIRHTFQRVSILPCSSPVQHSFGDFFHPERTLPTGCALTAALVGVEFVNVVEGATDVSS